ncbi:hypothetical protein PCC9214_05479 (plasmid) [Planktothrix tepida]|uniref:Uncharacterized protein n=1 Tax=Planktothrix tepida PCC 9214 TaxID=671072 RepID=A0A1J1LU01_9CYAN|nr:hypothetical protein [Planktothrix tepida]CAD5988949.1 hypothetical protein PCC9214_05479 [Planktothrix tepida]CUR35686.1 conserved hypothetical protein [Planktothrix tepida PCC 9214]
MTESPDIRSILTSKSRAKVTPRDASLKSMQSASETALIQPQNREIEDPEMAEVKRLQTELERLPQMGKRLAVHLEQTVRSELMQLCEQAEVTPEIFIEAMVVTLQTEPELLAKIIQEAQKRLRQRKQAGVIRRTLAMMEKYVGEGKSEKGKTL